MTESPDREPGSAGPGALPGSASAWVEAAALRKPTACVACQAFTHVPGTRTGGHDYQPPRRVGHHAYGADASGRMVVHRPSMAGEVTADFPYLERRDGDWVRPGHDGLEQALSWARQTLARDQAVDHVVICQSVQEYEGRPSKLGRTVTVVTRSGAGSAEGPGGAPERAAGQLRPGAAAGGRRARTPPPRRPGGPEGGAAPSP